MQTTDNNADNNAVTQAMGADNNATTQVIGNDADDNNAAADVDPATKTMR
jgi:hypothetical protein